MGQRNLTAKDILQKEFKPALRGFNTAEVDEYLDLIIRDYESYEKEISYLKNENERLKRQLKEQNGSSSAKTGTDSRRPASELESTTNYDILMRLSRLEKTVYGRSRSQFDNGDDSDDSDDDAYETRVFQTGDR